MKALGFGLARKMSSKVNFSASFPVRATRTLAGAGAAGGCGVIRSPEDEHLCPPGRKEVGRGAREDSGEFRNVWNLWLGLQMGREGLEPSTLRLRVSCSTN